MDIPARFVYYLSTKQGKSLRLEMIARPSHTEEEADPPTEDIIPIDHENIKDGMMSR